MTGKQLRDIKDKDGKSFGDDLLKSAAEGKLTTVEYKWTRPGSEAPVQKIAFVTRVADQVCAVGYYK